MALPKIQQICSLGTFCHTANHYQLRGLRHCSYPFDWILSSPTLVLDCLRDDFQTFMNPSHHIKIGENISNHAIYGTMVLGNNFQGKHPQHITFTHRDITNPETYQYYQRCIERFYNLLQQPGEKLFVLTTQDVEYDREIIQTLYEELTKRSNGVHLLCVSFFNDYGFHTHVEKGPIAYMKVYTYSRTDGRGFAIPQDNDYFHDALVSHYDLSACKKV